MGKAQYGQEWGRDNMDRSGEGTTWTGVGKAQHGQEWGRHNMDRSGEGTTWTTMGAAVKTRLDTLTVKSGFGTHSTSHAR